jgi:hypothetical protein
MILLLIKHKTLCIQRNQFQARQIEEYALITRTSQVCKYFVEAANYPIMLST